ncbi:MAG: glycosyltransferase family 4 protein [Actinomycetota bacterium]
MTQTASANRSRRPLRVAQIVTTLARGGAQATVMASAEMSADGVAVTVLAGPDRTDEGSFWDDERAGDAGSIPEVVEVPDLVRRPAPVKDVLALVWLVRWLRRHRPDVVHTHSSKAGVLGRLAARAVGIPCAHTVHGWGPLYATSPVARRVAVTIERVLARCSAALIVVGRADLRYGLDHGIGSTQRYRLIRSGIDTALATAAAARRDEIRSELGLGDRFVVGMVARMAYPKDHASLVAAVADADLGDAVLVLIGDGPERAEVERLAVAAGLGERIRILGLRPDAATVVAAFDVAVLASRWEGMPRSVVEAAAAGVPVIATDVGSVADLIEDGVSGRLVPPGDVAALAQALVDVHASPAARRIMADAARERSVEFSVDRMRRELRDLWRELAGRPSTAPDVTGDRSARDRHAARDRNDAQDRHGTADLIAEPRPPGTAA